MKTDKFLQLICLTLLIINNSITQGLSAERQRPEIIDAQLDCVDRSLQEAEAISWNDICYSWDKPRDTNREKAIDSALDDYEENRLMKNSPFSHPDYPRMSDAWGKSLSQYKEKPRASQAEIDEWLKKDYPYFYQEHIEQQEEVETYYGDEEPDAKDSRLAALIKNIDYGVIFQSDVEPTYYFETVFPVFQTGEKEHTFFSHDRISLVSDQDGSYSAGLGYRYFDKATPYIFGINSFYDFQQHGDHYRMGYGAEFIKEDVEARVNFYNGLSPQRGSGVDFEQAVDGFDAELGMTVPKFHLAKIFGGYQWYDYNHADDRQGWKTRLELIPAPSLKLNFEAVDENESDIRYRFDGRFNLTFTTFDPRDIMADIKGESTEPTRISLEDRLLERVERDFNIRTEGWIGEPVDDFGNVFISVQMPAIQCGFCLDSNGNLIADPGDGFELYVSFENISDQTVTGINISNITLSNEADFNGFGTPGVNVLPDAPPGATVTTDEVADIDIDIEATAAVGAQTFISFDLTAGSETRHFTFGPLIVGTTGHGQQFF